MKIIDKIIEFFNRRKQLKLDKARNEKINDFNENIIKGIEEILADKQYSTEQEKYEKIYVFLRNNASEAINLGIIDQKDVNQLAKHFKDNQHISKAITLEEKNQAEQEITSKLDYTMDIEEIEQLINQYVERFCLDKNKLKVFSEKEKFNIIKEMIKKNFSADVLAYKLQLLEAFYRNTFISKIVNGRVPKEVARLYKEYVSEFLENNPELESQFRGEFAGEEDILRKIELMKELDASYEFTTMEEVPLFLDMTREKVDQKANAELAKEKEKGDITAEDLLLIRTTQVFPKDGIVEHIGQHSEVEITGNPFMLALETIDPTIKKEDFEVLAPRFRWTTHWCVNGIVGDHTQGTFSGRDFFIIEDASEQTENPNLLNMLVADTIFLGDMKLSSKARIMMSIEKYQELMQDTKMKKQLTKMNIIVYKGNPSEALKYYMNERGYIYGSMSSFSYSYVRDLGPEYDYLTKIEDSLKKGQVTGLEHCAYTSDEGLRLSAMRNPELVQDNFRDLIEATNKMRGIKTDNDKWMDASIYGMSASIDDMLTYDTWERYVKYLENKFPNMQKLTEDFIKARQENELTEFSQNAEIIIRKVGLDKIKEATKEFNEIIKEEQKIARAQKDKQLLDEGLITQEEYNDRVSDDEEIKR